MNRLDAISDLMTAVTNFVLATPGSLATQAIAYPGRKVCTDMQTGSSIVTLADQAAIVVFGATLLRYENPNCEGSQLTLTWLSFDPRRVRALSHRSPNADLAVAAKASLCPPPVLRPPTPPSLVPLGLR